ncbi:ornithine-acyl-ACP acyltransferase [Maritimibacter sp. 55A14]|uniref:GNAT family N-acetyltransferase n=1 Tax=Maritimibacter sp. 55A14 TaxID=2174844 RepID=UPI000D6157F0|nr:GNAT family N-acyltransferase [Maritimibacter sp. 55A14]PWE33961.1 ornithine-acyl-ACP acyltransferase [Maritimibacter sp. 55A14]
MRGFSKGRYRARFAEGTADVEAAQRLRYAAFIAARGAGRGLACEEGRDADAFDAACAHVLVEDTRTGRLVCCFRILHLSGGAEIGRSYSAQYYELSALEDFDGPMVEMGRFCIHPDVHDPDVLRVAWAAMTRYVDAQGVEMLFGCSSFDGTEAEAYMDAFALLAERHLAPKRWLPRVKAPAVFRFARKLGRSTPDLKLAMSRMPPLLRTYLLMGGWVSDHAVVDRELNTLHVFTGLEIRAIPPGRARLLRATAG